MPRRLLYIVALVATLLVACGGQSTAPALTDPKDILTKSITSLEGLKTVHVKAGLSGKVDPGTLTGSTGGAAVDLTGSTLEGDIDLADSEGKASVALPTLFGFTADAIATGGQAWIKTSLNPDGKYHKVDTSSILSGLPLPSGLALPSAAASASPNPSAVAAAMDQLKAQLDKLTTPPVKLADEKIGDEDCYHVQFKVTPADMAESSPGASPAASGPTGTATVTVDVWTRKSDYRPARLVVAADAGTQGNLTATIDLTDYDAAVTVTPPPADQVSDQPFTIPGLTQ
jgi:hypothetical protein